MQWVAHDKEHGNRSEKKKINKNRIINLQRNQRKKVQRRTSEVLHRLPDLNTVLRRKRNKITINKKILSRKKKIKLNEKKKQAEYMFEVNMT